MHVAVQYKCDEFRSQIEQDIARFGAKLERWLEHYDSDLVSLHACFDKHARKRTYLITLNLTLPGTRLHASASNLEARFALRRAFDEMEMQISKRQHRARKAHRWKRKRLRRQVPANVEA